MTGNYTAAKLPPIDHSTEDAAELRALMRAYNDARRDLDARLRHAAVRIMETQAKHPPSREFLLPAFPVFPLSKGQDGGE